MYTRVGSLIIRRNKILVTAHDYPGGRLWHLPGGRVKAGETLKQALERELIEELGIRVAVRKLVFVCDEIQPNRHILHVLFNANILDGEPVINKSNTNASAVSFMPLEGISFLYPNLLDETKNYIEKGLKERNNGIYLGNCRVREWL